MSNCQLQFALFFSLLLHLAMRTGMYDWYHPFLLFVLQFWRPYSKHTIGAQFRHNALRVVSFWNWILPLEIPVDEAMIIRSLVMFGFHLQEVVHNFYSDVLRREVLHIYAYHQIIGFLNDPLFSWLALLTLQKWVLLIQ